MYVVEIILDILLKLVHFLPFSVVIEFTSSIFIILDETSQRAVRAPRKSRVNFQFPSSPKQDKNYQSMRSEVTTFINSNPR